MVATSARLAKTTTNLPPCCLRIHPNDTSRIYIGTYKLEEDTGIKHGSLDVYTYKGAELSLVTSIPTKAAILDMKFNPQDASQLISAHSNGQITVWRVGPNVEDLTKVKGIVIDEDETNCITSIFYNPNDPNKVLLTLTSGSSVIADLVSQAITPLEGQHSLECWTGSFGELGQLNHVAYTGGDDSQLVAHDLRTSQPIWTLSRGHDAGVVSILSPSSKWNASNGNLLWTGSYDDNLRVWDLRCIDKSNPSLLEGYIPRKLHEENLGGGVWRLIPSPLEKDERLLSCCMYDGARIVNTRGDDFSVDRYFKKDHASMCYGGDWSFDGKFVATCSFYDKAVQVWSPDEVEDK
ncbi:hypothetical protein KGF57_002595 [Candida theae]|uniref:methylated diphthine methylhydrolase n=1 Tax=Candida theae TaxID=1198502 RepID=A0AAD5BF21_9ASCO|nr:uncharacterized protein KGF57_002595 [Candida theae]KAI5958240.1 hypothetical protein KGF57_002595 [Candida theae]